MWTKHNSVLRMPTIPDITIGSTIWNGSGDHAGYYLYQLNSQWIIAKHIGVPYRVASGTWIYPTLAWLNGYCYYSGNYALWYDSSNSSWVVSSTALIGKPLTETWDSDAGLYTGDAWYSGTLPALNEEAITSSNFNMRGSLRGSVEGSFAGTILVETTSEYFKRLTTPAGDYPAGHYKNIGDDVRSTALKSVGIPNFTDQNDADYTRSISTVSGKYTYGDINYDATNEKWIIGTYESILGWWEGSEPSIDDPVTFTFTKPVPEEGEEEIDDQDNLTITFEKYVIGTSTTDGYIFNVGRWHP